MDAVLSAGGTPAPGEPLYEYTRGMPKALLEIHGKPMIQWVLDAVTASPAVNRIVITGLPQGCILDYHGHPAEFLPNAGSMFQNLRAGVMKIAELNPEAKHVLSVASDIPSLTPEMVDWVVKSALETEHDIHYSVITRQVMEARFPASKRTYLRLRDYDLCGGDINAIRVSTVLGQETLWERLIAARKSPLKQASLLGWDLLLLLTLRLISLDDTVRRASKRLHINGRAVICPYAEVGMDIDKPHQLEMMRACLESPAWSLRT